jgi:hypothetical protein
MPMFDWIVMDLVKMSLLVPLVADHMLPVAPLPNPPLALALTPVR